MDTNLIHGIIGLIGVIIAAFLGRESGKAKIWIIAHAQMIEAAVKTTEAQAEAFWSGELAKIKAASELAKESFEAKLSAVEARAAADLAKANTGANAEIARIQAEAEAKVAAATEEVEKVRKQMVQSALS